MNDINKVLVVGAGYLGKEVARLSRQAGHEVYATTRHPHRFETLAAIGCVPIQFDWTDSRTYRNLPWKKLGDDVSVLVAVSYDRHSRHSRYDSQVGGLRRFLSVLPPAARLCYISTTGVYHQTGGQWVDETSPTQPTREGGRVHLQAENLLPAQRPEAPWMVLRLAGIYGPGRLPRIADVLAGRPIASPAAGHLNLIHVHDAARASLAAFAAMGSAGSMAAETNRKGAGLGTGMQSRLFVVSDDAPVVRGDFYREIARQCRVAPPRFVSPQAGSSVSFRSESDKRVWNRKMRRRLLTRLEFPDYHCGLADVLDRTLE